MTAKSRYRSPAPLFRRRDPVIAGDCTRCSHPLDAHSRFLGCMVGWMLGSKGCGCEATH